MSVRAALRRSDATTPGAASGPLRLEANLLALPFGLAGLAQCWSVAADHGDVPHWPADLCWLLAAAAWLVTTVGYLRHLVAGHRLGEAPADPVFGPFTALVVIVLMPLGVAWARHHPGQGRALFLVAMTFAIGYGGWLSGQWIISPLRLEQWHPGYLLPTVAGGLLAAGGAAALGYATLARVLLGYGGLCWLVLGSIVLARLFIGPPLPAALTPTLAIELAPPVVAGNSWFLINGGRADGVALFIAGYAVLMALVQIRLVPVFRRLRFGPGWWAFSFSYAAAVAYTLRWVALGERPWGEVATGVLLALVTVGIGGLLGRTLVGLARGTYLPRAAPAQALAPEAAAPAVAEGR